MEAILIFDGRFQIAYLNFCVFCKFLVIKSKLTSEISLCFLHFHSQTGYFHIATQGRDFVRQSCFPLVDSNVAVCSRT
jgi:hypothetical protein